MESRYRIIVTVNGDLCEKISNEIAVTAGILMQLVMVVWRVSNIWYGQNFISLVWLCNRILFLWIEFYWIGYERVSAHTCVVCWNIFDKQQNWIHYRFLNHIQSNMPWIMWGYMDISGFFPGLYWVRSSFQIELRNFMLCQYMWD